MRVCSFVCCKDVCKSGLSSTNALQWDTIRFNTAFFHWIPPVSVVQFTVQMSRLNGLEKTHQERTFVVKLKSKLRSLFHYEQIVWENSDIKWIKVPSPKQIHSETNIFLSTKVIWEREKRGLISYLSAWGSDRRLCLKILPSRKNEICFPEINFERRTKLKLGGFISYSSKGRHVIPSTLWWLNRITIKLQLLPNFHVLGLGFFVILCKGAVSWPTSSSENGIENYLSQCSCTGWWCPNTMRFKTTYVNTSQT